MSTRRRFTPKLLGIGYIFSELHYGIFARNWWEPVSLELKNTVVTAIPFRLYMCITCNLIGKDFILTVVKNNKNQLKPGFQCTCECISSEMELYSSTAINSCYQKVFNTKTEYSGISIMGFDDKNIIQQLLDKVEFIPIFLRIEKFSTVISGIGYSSFDQFYGAGTGFISSFITRYKGLQHLFLLRIEDSQCIVEIYLDDNKIQQYIGLTPDDVWKNVGVHKNFLGSYIFGITHESIQQLLNFGNQKFTCLPNEWCNHKKLSKIFDCHIMTRKIPNTMINWIRLLDDWYKQHSTIVQFPSVLTQIYPENYKFQNKELRAWRAMFQACGCSDITPLSRTKSQIEFWSKAYDIRADKENLYNLYKTNLLSIDNKSESITTQQKCWESFQNAMNSNKRGQDGRVRILSIIALKFRYIDLQQELKVTPYIINKARKHARLHGPGAPPLNKIKRTVQRIDVSKEEQFKIVFQDRENVTMSSYQIEAKSGLPILYLRDQKCNLWNKYSESYPTGIKRTNFMARLQNSKNLKYRDDLGGLCQICNDYGYETFENLSNIIRSNFEDKTIMNTVLNKLDNLKRQMKRGFEKELKINLDGKVTHNPCISHCLLYAFGECDNNHETRCSECDQFFNFFNFMSKNISENWQSKLIEAKEKLLYYLSHQARKVYLNAQFKTTLLELDLDGAIIIADYKMRILPQSARETKQDFFGKRGWTLHTILIFTKEINSNELNIAAYDHWSLDTKQDAWFTASAFEAVFETIEKKPKWIRIISDNGPHYHNSELMAIISHWHDWYNIEIKSWLFLEPGEAKTTVDSHHAAITHAIKRYLRIGCNLSCGDDIVQAVKGLSGTSLANLEPNRNIEDETHELEELDKSKNIRKKKSKMKTIKGISKLFYWEWPCQDKYAGYIRARPLPHVGKWSNFSPSCIADLWNSPLYRSQPTVSQYTVPETKWTMPITVESDSFGNGIDITENNIENEGIYNFKISYIEKNTSENLDIWKIIDIIDLTVISNNINNIEDIDIDIEDITENNIENEGIYNFKISYIEKNTSENLDIWKIIDIIDLTVISNNINNVEDIAKGWALKGTQKFGGRGGKRIKKEIKTLLELFFLNGNRQQKDKMSAREMHIELMKYVETEEFLEEDIPKVSTIQNWINSYARIFKERATERELNNE
ncbi:hypothetical protein Glove_9g308 [Diversispora epigaea]|uniref:Uncharacterized protein n=1 Tax=Diversispora epigaea TaxID=1348612 RepID=A0A397JRJ7_9GLOM|nr:hypothetical protein Glove_9g308 [Diversispora epigaea]